MVLRVCVLEMKCLCKRCTCDECLVLPRRVARETFADFKGAIVGVLENEKFDALVLFHCAKQQCSGNRMFIAQQFVADGSASRSFWASDQPTIHVGAGFKGQITVTAPTHPLGPNRKYNHAMLREAILYALVATNHARVKKTG